MQRAIRNAGRPGVGAMAISAVDVALWDLKARLIGVALVDLLPRKALAFSGLFAGFTVGATPLLYALALTTVEGGSQEFVAALVYPGASSHRDRPRAVRPLRGHHPRGSRRRCSTAP
ncbi:MAG: hypothetical protein M3459_01070 [Actinomycetota bacterium]|nr:hypothetical protein [Actinomycetota bacterium]